MTLRFRRLSLGLLLGTILAPAWSPSAAQGTTPPAPATLPAGRAADAVRAYLAALDKADSVAIKAWLTRFDPEGDLVLRTNRQLGLARRTGGFTVNSIVRNDDGAIEAILNERKTRVAVRLELVLNAGGTAEMFGLEPIMTHAEPAPAAGAPSAPALTQAALVARLRALVENLARTGQFSGVVSLSKGGTAVFEQAYGDADRDKRVANTVETAFNLGSINKIFTSIAINQLAASGRLMIDSSLARAWPEFPNPDVAKRVTIRQILQHTSGIAGNIFAPPGISTSSQIRHNRQIVAAIANTPLAFAPGSRNSYSNAGYVVLGGLVERVSGQDYYSYVQQHVYTPAGMTRSGHFASDSLPARTAIGYTRSGNGSQAPVPLHANSGMLPGRGSAAGGGYTTAGDLRKFLTALRTQKIAAGPPAGLGIAGGSPGVNAVIEGDLPGGYDLIVLSNFDPPAAERIAERVRQWLGVRD